MRMTETRSSWPSNTRVCGKPPRMPSTSTPSLPAPTRLTQGAQTRVQYNGSYLRRTTRTRSVLLLLGRHNRWRIGERDHL